MGVTSGRLVPTEELKGGEVSWSRVACGCTAAGACSSEHALLCDCALYCCIEQGSPPTQPCPGGKASTSMVAAGGTSAAGCEDALGLAAYSAPCSAPNVITRPFAVAGCVASFLHGGALEGDTLWVAQSAVG